MISPTNHKMRNDMAGLGHYRAKRGKKLHMGVDFLCEPFQKVYAPFDMVIERKAAPKINTDMQGIAFWNEHLSGKMFYFLPHAELIGNPVKEGQEIGIAQDVSTEYNHKMKPHIHLQIDSIDPMFILNLSEAMVL